LIFTISPNWFISIVYLWIPISDSRLCFSIIARFSSQIWRLVIYTKAILCKMKFFNKPIDFFFIGEIFFFENTFK
jgi:hypothetical protein